MKKTGWKTGSGLFRYSARLVLHLVFSTPYFGHYIFFRLINRPRPCFQKKNSVCRLTWRLQLIYASQAGWRLRVLKKCFLLFALPGQTMTTWPHLIKTYMFSIAFSVCLTLVYIVHIMGRFIYILDSSNSSSFIFWSNQFASSSRSNWTGITVKDGRKITQNVLGEHKVITTEQ